MAEAECEDLWARPALDLFAEIGAEFLEVVAQRLEAHLVGNGRNHFVPFRAREGPYPAHVRRDDSQALADLGFPNLGARPLALDVGTERQAVDLVF